MVKIRYAELPAGLHVATKAADHYTVVYLKPGLTKAQRKDALLVARRSARFGHGPSLPPLDMAFALAADRTRTTARVATWAIRKHPLLLLPLLALIVGIVAASIMAAAAVVTVPSGVTSAQSGGLSEPNVGQFVYPSVSTGHGPSTGAPGFGWPGPGTTARRSGSPGSSAARHGRPVSRAGRAHHGGGSTSIHLAAGMPQSAAAAKRQGGGSSITAVEVVSIRHDAVHGPPGGGDSGHANRGAAMTARGHDGHAHDSAAMSPVTIA